MIDITERKSVFCLISKYWLEKELIGTGTSTREQTDKTKSALDLLSICWKSLKELA